MKNLIIGLFLLSGYAIAEQATFKALCDAHMLTPKEKRMYDCEVKGLNMYLWIKTDKINGEQKARAMSFVEGWPMTARNAALYLLRLFVPKGSLTYCIPSHVGGWHPECLPLNGDANLEKNIRQYWEENYK